MERDADARTNVILTALNAANQLYLSTLLKDLDESSDDESEIAGAFLTEAYVRLRGPNKKPPRIENFIEDVVPRFKTRQFRENYRMLPSTFKQLEQRLGPILQGDGGKPCVPVRTQLLASIWLLATPDCYRAVCMKHDLSKSSLSASMRRVVNALVNIAGEVIKWPTGQRLADVMHKFEQWSNLPNVIGAIDGCDVNNRAPNAQKRFNVILFKTRQVIERAFALLKGRFRRLKYLDMQKVELIPDFILACCVLHNICLIGLNGEVEEEDVEDFIQEGLQIQEGRDDEDDENVVLGGVRRAYLTAALADD